jgi:DNA-binding CsgD family transcriptional regulator
MAAIAGTRGPRAKLIGRRTECDTLDALVESVRGGESRALVLRGELGVGKTALLNYALDQASDCRVLRAVGVQSEMELAFAGLHQLCAPTLECVERLPAPQRDALRTAFGVSPGSAPDRFMVALAVLGLLSEMAEERPLVCLVDDEQWLDRASAQALAFVGRRLGAESVGLVFAVRGTSEGLAGLPQLVVEGLREADARALVASVLTGPLDAGVRDRIISETGGNPLALLELTRGLTPAELAGGFGLPSTAPLTGRIEEGFHRQLDALPAQTRRLMLLAAADPVGEPLLVWRAAELLGVGAEAATPAVEAGLIDFGARVRFRHPLVRSASYRSASPQKRRDVHRVLAAVTDPQVDPDRRAWHRARATAGPDEDVAEELERSASRAQARGGLAAAAAFLERSATLTRDPHRRVQRMLATARAKRDAGDLDAASALLMVVETNRLDDRQAAELEHLRGQVAFDQRRVGDAARLLLDAARRLEPLDADAARETHLEALLAAMWGGGLADADAVREAAEAARAAPPPSGSPRAVDVLLDALALRLTDGYTAAAPMLTRALELFLDLQVGSDDVGGWLWRAGSRACGIIAVELWDFESWHALAAGQVRFARETGALVHLQSALNFLGWTHMAAGELSRAARLIEESSLVAEATEYSPIAAVPMLFAAWRGQEPAASGLIEATSRVTTAAGLRMIPEAYSRAVLCNGLGHHDAARDAAWQAFEPDPVGFGPLVVSELAEAASRTGDAALVSHALEWISERSRVTPNEWALGIEARVRALAGEGDDAERLYRESMDRLSRTPARVEDARAHLLYGEWLRRESRRVEAREQLRIAHEMLDEIGVDAFAERARRELLATGETARKRTVETRDELTPQEAQIARLARDGLSNPEIGVRLFISPRTVKYHLRKVFTKLDITSRHELDWVLPSEPASREPL